MVVRSRSKATFGLLIVLSGLQSTAVGGEVYQRIDASFLDEAGRDECTLVTEKDIVCYKKRTHAIYHLRVDGHIINVRKVYAFPMVYGAPPEPEFGRAGILTRPYDLSAKQDDEGNIYVWWSFQNKDHTVVIDLLRIAPSGTTEKFTVVTFGEYEFVFHLRAALLGPMDIQFFYSDYSEKYFNVSDMGEKEKLWTLHWRNGKLLSKHKLSRAGRFHATPYAVHRRNDGSFDIVWIKQHAGFFVRKPRLEIARLIISAEGEYTLSTISSTKLDKKANLLYFFSVGGKTPAILAEFFGIDYHFLQMFDYQGTLVREPQFDPSWVDFDCSPRLGLCRYFKPIKGSLHYSREKQVELGIYWTNLSDRLYRKTIKLVPARSILLRQEMSDCFYWLESTNKDVRLQHRCRQ